MLGYLLCVFIHHWYRLSVLIGLVNACSHLNFLLKARQSPPGDLSSVPDAVVVDGTHLHEMACEGVPLVS